MALIVRTDSCSHAWPSQGLEVSRRKVTKKQRKIHLKLFYCIFRKVSQLRSHLKLLRNTKRTENVYHNYTYAKTQPIRYSQHTQSHYLSLDTGAIECGPITEDAV